MLRTSRTSWRNVLVSRRRPASGFRHDFLCKGDTCLDFKYFNRGRCYTIGFRHPHFHPMTADTPGVWNIQTADLRTGTPRANGSGLPAIPHQTVYSREDLAFRRRSGLQMAHLSYISRTALQDAKAIIAGKLTRPFNYGFILRSRNPEATGVYSDILCKSPLLCRIRQLVYQHPSQQVREEIHESSRLEYCALKAYLTPTGRDDFLSLFPEFKPCFTIYEQFVNSFIHSVLHIAPENNRQEDVVARAMLTHILHYKALKRDIVHDYVVCPEYAVLYLQALGHLLSEMVGH